MKVFSTFENQGVVGQNVQSSKSSEKMAKTRGKTQDFGDFIKIERPRLSEDEVRATIKKLKQEQIEPRQKIKEMEQQVVNAQKDGAEEERPKDPAEVSSLSLNDPHDVVTREKLKSVIKSGMMFDEKTRSVLGKILADKN